MTKILHKAVLATALSVSIIGSFVPAVSASPQTIESQSPEKSDNQLAITPISGNEIDLDIDTPSGNQMEWTIDGPEDSHEITFSVESSKEVRLEIDESSGAVIVYLDEEPSALINSPWAKDSNGDDVETYFKINGNKVTQYVDHLEDGSLYPIIADPRVNWGVISGHIYFSKDETRKMAGGAAGVMAISPFFAMIPPPVGDKVALWWGIHSFEVAMWAATAHDQGKCLALKVGYAGNIYPPSVGMSPEHYTDGCV